MITAPRRVLLPLMKVIKKKLEDMVLLGVIESIEQPTESCSGTVLEYGDVQICLDLTRLNKHIHREVHLMPGKNILGQVGGEKYFMKLDNN